MLRKIVISCMFSVFIITIGIALAAGRNTKDEKFTFEKSGDTILISH